MTTTVKSVPAEIRLKTLETQIERGAESIQEAIIEIHDNSLWSSGTYDSFVQYCRVRFGMSRTQAYRMLAHGRVLKNNAEILTPESPIGDSAPLESHSRHLNRLPAEEQGKVWQKALASSGGKPTANDVERAVNSETENERRDVETQIEKLGSCMRAYERHASTVSRIAYDSGLQGRSEFIQALNQAKKSLAMMIGQLRGASETEDQKLKRRR